MTKAGVPEKVIEGMRDPKKIPEQAVTTPVPTPAVTQTKQLATATKSGPAATTPPVTTAQPTPTVVTPVTTPVAPPVTVPVPTVATKAVASATVTDGTPFYIALAADIPAASEPGTPVRFTVTQDFKVGEILVIAKGTAVTGAIVDPAGKKFLGMGSKMTLRVDQTESTVGQKISLRAAPTGATRPVETTSAKPKSKDIVASAGAEYVAYIDGDQKVNVKK